MIFIIFGINGCNKENKNFDETINGFDVHWTSNLGNTQKAAIREMINNMVFIDGGQFQMGDSANALSSPVHTVNVSDFYINKFEITQDVWASVTGQTPTYDLSLQWTTSYGMGDKYPAYRISYNQASEFIALLNKYTGLRFSLPSEAQWEFAARGGNSTTYKEFSGSDNCTEVAWTNQNATKCNVVGTKAPNELGLYDMSGNVWEMCLDWYASYPSEEVTDPVGTDYGNGYKVFRGGSWNNNEQQARVTTRYRQGIHYVDYQTGIRLVHPAP